PSGADGSLPSRQAASTGSWHPPKISGQFWPWLRRSSAPDSPPRLHKVSNAPIRATRLPAAAVQRCCANAAFRQQQGASKRRSQGQLVGFEVQQIELFAN